MLITINRVIKHISDDINSSNNNNDNNNNDMHKYF